MIQFLFESSKSAGSTRRTEIRINDTTKLRGQLLEEERRVLSSYFFFFFYFILNLLLSSIIFNATVINILFSILINIINMERLFGSRSCFKYLNDVLNYITVSIMVWDPPKIHQCMTFINTLTSLAYILPGAEFLAVPLD